MNPYAEYLWLRRLRISRIRSAYIVSRRLHLTWLAKRSRQARVPRVK